MRVYIMVILGLLFPILGCFHYNVQLGNIPLELRDEYAYWLSPLWSPVMYASSMYIGGGVLGVVVGVLNADKHRLHRNNILRVVVNTLIVVLLGVGTWAIYDMMEFGEYYSFDETAQYMSHNIIAFLSIYQNIVFWAFLSYSVAVMIKSRIITFLLLVVEQTVEFLYVVQHHPSWEIVLPAAISRTLIAHAYPVWRTNTWASDHPSLLASSPMILSDNNVPLDTGLGWVIMVELIYLCLCACIIVWNILNRRVNNELVPKSKSLP